MSVLLQISDPHFGTDQVAVKEALISLVQKQKPNIAIWSGDITQRARRSQFESAKAFIKELAIPLTLAVPGNHDIPLFNLAARIFFPYRGFKYAFGDDLQPVFESDELLIICLNTTRPWRHKNGEVSQQQIHRVVQKTKAAKSSQLKMVVAHQPISVEQPSDEENLLIGYDKAIKHWANAGVELVLGGHIHRPHAHKIADYLGPPAGRLWSIQAGTAISKRTRGNSPNSVNLIRYDIKQEIRTCCVERWDYDSSAKYFQLFSTTDIPLPLATTWRRSK